MRFAFTTLACPGWTVDQVVDAAVRLGYDAVEWRLLDGELIEPIRDRDRLRRAVASCRAAGLQVCALDASCRFNHPDPAERERQVAELLHWIDRAQEVGVPVLRVFGGQAPLDGPPAPSDEVANGWVAEALRGAAPAAERAGVTVALETHDAFSSARRVAAVLDAVGSPAIAALWDSHHPYRAGEPVDVVLEALGPRLAHVHVKDARRTGPGAADWELVPLGAGEVPVRRMLGALVAHGYNGYVALEWEKKWHPELAEPEEALPAQLAWLRAVARDLPPGDPGAPPGSGAPAS